MPLEDGMLRYAALRAILLVAALSALGCASTRVASMGPLPDGPPLITMTVSEDPSVIEHECGALLRDTRGGCERFDLVTLPGGALVRTVRIARHADSLPSAMAFEIDLHELCHAVAAVQPIEDPCHRGNGGRLQSTAAASHHAWHP